jgi:hypothetical protein
VSSSNDLPEVNGEDLPEVTGDNLPTVSESASTQGDDYSFGENLTYMFKDPDWVMKILLGGLLGIIPIVNFVTAGYGLHTINNVRGDAEPVLPEWKGFGDMWVEGLKLFIIGLIYSIPIWIIMLLTGAPAALLGSMSSGEGDGFGALAAGTACLGGLLSLVVGAFILFWILGAITNFAVNDGDFGAAFQFGKIWDILKANLGKMVMAVIAAVIASVIVGVLAGVLAIIPCLGWIAAWVISFVASFYILLVIAYTCGHIAKTI